LTYLEVVLEAVVAEDDRLQDVAPCILIGTDRRLRRAYRKHQHQQQQRPEDGRLYARHRESLKSQPDAGDLVRLRQGKSAAAVTGHLVHLRLWANTE
jgi:hypothetical protein